MLFKLLSYFKFFLKKYFQVFFKHFQLSLERERVEFNKHYLLTIIFNGASMTIRFGKIIIKKE